MTEMPLVRFDNVVLRFEDTTVLDGINLKVWVRATHSFTTVTNLNMAPGRVANSLQHRALARRIPDARA
jgi:hypothetical protein